MQYSMDLVNHVLSEELPLFNFLDLLCFNLYYFPHLCSNVAIWRCQIKGILITCVANARFTWIADHNTNFYL